MQSRYNNQSILQSHYTISNHRDVNKALSVNHPDSGDVVDESENTELCFVLVGCCARVKKTDLSFKNDPFQAVTDPVLSFACASYSDDNDEENLLKNINETITQH